MTDHLNFISFEHVRDDMYTIDTDKETVKSLKRCARLAWRKGKIKKKHIQLYGINRDPRSLRDKVAALIGVAMQDYVDRNKTDE